MLVHLALVVEPGELVARDEAGPLGVQGREEDRLLPAVPAVLDRVLHKLRPREAALERDGSRYLSAPGGSRHRGAEALQPSRGH